MSNKLPSLIDPSLSLRGETARKCLIFLDQMASWEQSEKPRKRKLKESDLKSREAQETDTRHRLMKNKKTQKLLSGLVVSLCVLALSTPVSFATCYDISSGIDFIRKLQKFEGENEKILDILIKGTEDGMPIAQVYLAKLYYFGWLDVDTDYDKSYKLVKEMALKECGEAQDLLGIHYAFGQGVEENLINALTWAQLSRANTNDFLQIGSTAAHKNIEEAIELYKSKMPDWAILIRKEKARRCWSSNFQYCEDDLVASRSRTMEEKLTQAKEYFSKGLITKPVYQEVKDYILNAN